MISAKLPLHLRKNNLARLLARRVNGIFLADFEQGEIGLGQGQEPRASRYEAVMDTFS